MDAIEIKMMGGWYGADKNTLECIAAYPNLMTNPQEWPLCYWFIQLMLAGF